MQSNCIREASNACFKTCCVKNPLPEPRNPSPASDIIDPRREFLASVLTTIQPNTTFTNHESIPSLTELFVGLRSAFPRYADTVLADHIRTQEYYHLMQSNSVCLDYIGHGLFSYSQIKGSRHNDKISSTDIASSSSLVPEVSSRSDAPCFNVSFNSSSLSSYLLSSSQETEFEREMRARIMRYMNVFEEDYTLVFTANQSSAFKLLADSFPFQSNQSLLTVYDHENEAVQVMIDNVKSRGAQTQSALFSWPNLSINSKKLRRIITKKSSSNSKLKRRGLFVFPPQSKITGSRYSYQWMNLARENGWHVLLDASALGAKYMETLGLSLFEPDFLICSFFKIFGENPSGFCCLFIKKSEISYITQRSSTSVGIVSLIPAKFASISSLSIDETDQQNQETSSSSEIEKVMLEENMKRDASIKSSTIECRGLDHADTLGLILISTRARYLTNWLVNALLSLRHPNSTNGLSLVVIYGPRIKLDRGQAIALNVYDWKGEKVDPTLVQKLADRNNISVTCAYLNNIWFAHNHRHMKYKLLEIKTSDAEKKKGKREFGIRAVSVSLGMLSNFDDVYRFWCFLAKFLDADFVEKERWRYTALNQTTVEV